MFIFMGRIKVHTLAIGGRVCAVVPYMVNVSHIFAMYGVMAQGRLPVADVCTIDG